MARRAAGTALFERAASRRAARGAASSSASEPRGSTSVLGRGRAAARWRRPIWPELRFVPDVVAPPARRAPAWSEREGALAELVRAHLALLGPTTASATRARAWIVPSSDVEAALARVEMEGDVLRGRFVTAELAAGGGPVANADELQWCDRRLLARINRRMLDGLRSEIEPVTAADFMRFLFSWQHVRPGTAAAGARRRWRRSIAQLQGFEIAAGAWEREVLPARVAGYDTAWLDALCLSGEVAWGRLARARGGAARPAARRRSRSCGAAICPGCCVPGRHRRSTRRCRRSRRRRATCCASSRRRARASSTRSSRARDRLRAEVEDALWELVCAGRVTGDGFAGLRALISATQSRGSARARWHARWARRAGGAPAGAGRWALAARAAAAARGRRRSGGARAPVRQALRRRLPRRARARDARAALARPPARLPPPRDARRAARRAPRAPASSASSSPRPRPRGAARDPHASRRAARSCASPPAIRSTWSASSRPARACRRRSPTRVLFKDGVPQLGAEEAPAPATAADLPARASLTRANLANKVRRR